MKVISFIEPSPREVAEKILRHCGPWQASAPRPPPDDGQLEDLDWFVGTWIAANQEVH